MATGCLADAVAVGQSRAKRVECLDELPRGALVSGRINDIVVENARVKLVIRAFGEGYVFPGTGFGGIDSAGGNLLR